jgi:hypothetical protein
VQYLALIYGDQDRWEAFSEPERASWHERFRAFADEATSAGVYLGGEGLAHTRDATTVRVRETETLVTDGPYAEVKEALGGYFLFDCESIDEAIEWASRSPGVEYGAIEVRPVHSDPDEVQL